MPVNLLAVLNEPNAPLQATAAATLALLVKHIVTVFAQGGARFGAGMRPPEDVCFMPQAGTQSFDGTAKTAEKGNEDKGLKKAKEIEQRWTRIVANDLENIPLGLIIAWGALQSPLSASAHIVLVFSFAVSRVLHTVTYAMGKQPHRAITFFGGLLSVVGLSINGLLGALGKK
ncbi:membrane associated eicosanoid glutathione metabolism-like domain protein [Nannochloropsis oceanica]